MSINKVSLEPDGLVVGNNQLVTSGGGVSVGRNLVVQGSTYTGNLTTTGNTTISGNANAANNTLFVDSVNNRVGVGSNSPGTKLDVYTSGSTSTIIRDRNDTTTVYLDANNSYSYLNTSTNHPMLFGTNNTERMRIDNAGRVTITGTFAATGVPVQMVYLRYDTKTTYSVPTYNGGIINITDLNTTITPRSATSKILIQFSPFYEVHQDTIFKLYRNVSGADTAIGTNSTDSSAWSGIWTPGYDPDNNSTPMSRSFFYYDTPGTTLPVTYKMMIQSSGVGATTFYLNRSIGSAGQAGYEVGISQVFIKEIAGEISPLLIPIDTTGSFIVATGGTITISGNYKIHTFTATADFVVTNLGVSTPTVDYLIVGGGGGGGSWAGGGGGGGGYRVGSFTVSATSYTATVGGGGTAGVYPSGPGGPGGNSSIFSVTATGGGGGLPYNGPAPVGGAAGQLNGFTGGNGSLSSGKGWSSVGGGGGGGATAVGSLGTSAQNAGTGGNGGAGYTNNISGISTVYGSGGGGYGTATRGIGGTNAGNSAETGIAGATNRGGGGGAGGNGGGGAGGSGIIIIKYAFA